MSITISPANATARVYAFDRITIAIDRPALPKAAANRLNRGCKGGLKPEPGYMEFNPKWQCQLKLFQPSEEALRVLIECLGDQIGAIVTGAELAVDMICEQDRDALATQAWIAERLVFRRQRDSVIREQGTTDYYSRRTSPRSGKRGRVGVVYADKPSKLNSKFFGRTCVHLECRFTGSQVLASIGIASVSDLLTFNHEAFWRSAVTLFQLPSRTELGRLLDGPGGNDVSGTALRKRAMAAIDGSSSAGQFFMHSLVRRHPDLRRKLEKLSLDTLLGVA